MRGAKITWSRGPPIMSPCSVPGSMGSGSLSLFHTFSHNRQATGQDNLYENSSLPQPSSYGGYFSVSSRAERGTSRYHPRGYTCHMDPHGRCPGARPSDSMALPWIRTSLPRPPRGAALQNRFGSHPDEALC